MRLTLKDQYAIDMNEKGVDNSIGPFPLYELTKEVDEYFYPYLSPFFSVKATVSPLEVLNSMESP